MEADVVLFVAVFVLSCGWILLQWAFLQRIRSRHPGIGRVMGLPSSEWGYSLTVVFRILMFILGRRHARLGDRTLSVLGDSLLAVLLLDMVASVVLAVYPFLVGSGG